MLAVRAGSLFLFVTFPDHLAASEVKVSSEGMVLSVQVSLLHGPCRSQAHCCRLLGSLFPRVLVPLNSAAVGVLGPHRFLSWRFLSHTLDTGNSLSAMMIQGFSVGRA